MSRPQVWYWAENHPAELGVSVPRVAQDQALRIFLEHENIEPETVDVDTLRWLHDQMRFVMLWSVITADVEGGDVDEAEIGSYHSNGSGRRRKPAWFNPLRLLGACRVRGVRMTDVPFDPDACRDCTHSLHAHHVDRLDAELGRTDKCAINWCQQCGGACRLPARVVAV